MTHRLALVLPAGFSLITLQETRLHVTNELLALAVRGMLCTAALLNFAGMGLAQTFEVLHSFTGVNDGSRPIGGLTIGEDGILYGTTTGTEDLNSPTRNGTVFSLAPPTSGGGVWTLSTIFNLVNYPTYGRIPVGTLAIGSEGILYGTIEVAGAGGSVFSLTPPATLGGAWTPNLLTPDTGGGTVPYAGVVIGSGGVLYGTTEGQGTVFAVAPPSSAGGAWTYSVLHSFDGSPDGASAFGAVAIGKNGILYGGTHSGGAYGDGIVYSLTPAPMPESWTENILLNFDGTDGNADESTLVFGEGGILYGTTVFGGPTGCVYGCGTVFSLTPPATTGAAWSEAVLFAFGGEIGGGVNPRGGVAVGKGGVLYGTTINGGAYGLGTIYSLTPPSSPGGAWTHAILHSFDKTDGEAPLSTLAIGNDGTLYGTTEYGGSDLYGVVFALKP
jgi:uncharacterized repeat protein (TIGR03803 family)